MESKEVTYLTRLFSNGGRDHGGRAGAARLVARGLQAEQKAARCSLPLRPLSGGGLDFRAGDGAGALSGCSGRVMMTAPPSCRVPPCRRLSMQGTSGAAAHGSGMHASVVMF